MEGPAGWQLPCETEVAPAVGMTKQGREQTMGVFEGDGGALIRWRAIGIHAPRAKDVITSAP